MQDVLGSLPLDLLWDATHKHGQSHTCFLSLDSCLVCAGTLTTHNQPIVCICYTPDGPIPAVKIPNGKVANTAVSITGMDQ